MTFRQFDASENERSGTMKKISICTLTCALALSGCANMDPVQSGTAKGAGIGAGVGAVLGAATGPGGGRRAAAGAALGGAAGAVIGNVWSTRMENQKRAMEQAAQGTGVQVVQTPDNRLKLEIPADISFNVNRADIQPDFRPVLDRFASNLKQYPETNISIVGHTDSTGSDAVNDPLSLNRAIQTREYLATRGVDPARINVVGRGEHEPIASNASESGRARNRRVEIYVAEPQYRSTGQ
jgi:outer membrane protein OmpA-like peptidoglycan-associated protein